MVRVLLVGIGGYGNGYVDAVLDRGPELGVELAGVVDPAPEGCRRLAEVTDSVGRIHATLDDFFAHDSADLAVISAPIHLHQPFTTRALEHGAHVLCEKPIAGSLDDLEAMQEAERSSGRSVTVGFQWSFSEPIRQLRADIASGRFGSPRRLRAFISWPRTFGYYDRAVWPGRLRMPTGEWVRDSPVSNATAHYLHNLFFLLSQGPLGSAEVARIEANLSRVNAIETFDTAVLRLQLDSGAQLHFTTSHAAEARVDPVFSLEFEHASVSHSMPGPIVARLANGSTVDYGTPRVDHPEKLALTARAIENGTAPPCSLADATPHLQVTCALDYDGVANVPAELVRETSERRWVTGLTEVLVQAYATGALPVELGQWVAR